MAKKPKILVTNVYTKLRDASKAYERSIDFEKIFTKKSYVIETRRNKEVLVDTKTDEIIPEGEEYNITLKKNDDPKLKAEWEIALENYKKQDSTAVKGNKIKCYYCGNMIKLDEFLHHLGV